MSRTVLINCSPKRRLSVSGFILRCLGLLIRGEKEYMHLRTPADHQMIIDALMTADNAVFAVPLYVDGVPSHMLPFLEKLEKTCLENKPNLNVYVAANNGFIEGRQNEPMLQVIGNFCARSQINWRGGIGIGGGVMLNVTRIMLLVMLAITLINMLLAAAGGQNVLEPLSSFLIGVLENAILCCGIIAYTARLAFHINRGTDAGRKYTRIMLPSFVFILFADIFFAIISVFQGGIFRGWLKKHKPAQKCDIIDVRNN